MRTSSSGISGLPARSLRKQHCGENRTSTSVRSRKAARWDSELTEKIYQPLKINDMKKRILTALCCICLLSAGRAHAQWVVTDPGNLAQGIINAAKNIVHTSSTASNMVKNFQETVKIYQQGKEYYDGLRKVKNLVRDARKVQQTILMVGDITEIYVTSYERMLSDPYFTPEELSAIALGYTKLLEESANLLTDLKTVVNENGLSMNDKERIERK